MTIPRLVLVTILAAGICIPYRVSYATSDSAGAYSVYFTAMADTGAGGVSQFYARHWRTWLQFHRAIESTPSLRRQVLKLPSDPYEGRKGAKALIHKKLSMKFVKAQSSHVFILQLGAFKTSDGLSTFMTKQWPKVAKKSVYETIPKDFRVSYSSEAVAKSDPIFLRKDQSLRRLCYGIYASRDDAKRDAAQFKKHLGYQPIIKQQPLTAQLARSFIFEPVAGKMP